MNLQNILKLVLLGLIVWLTYETIETVAKPLRFEKERDRRYAAGGKPLHAWLMYLHGRIRGREGGGR